MLYAIASSSLGTLSDILTNITTVLTFLFGLTGDLFTAITTNPLIFVAVLMSLGATAISVTVRIIRKTKRAAQ